MKLTDQDMTEIKRLSERCGVRELVLFGSALSMENFSPESDVDLAVTFRDPRSKGRFTAYMDLKEALEGLFHRPVDLVSTDAVRNPVFRDELLKSQKVLYAASA
jgi:predicted nucleotidyltransferase